MTHNAGCATAENPRALCTCTMVDDKSDHFLYCPRHIGLAWCACSPRGGGKGGMGIDPAAETGNAFVSLTKLAEYYEPEAIERVEAATRPRECGEVAGPYRCSLPAGHEMPHAGASGDTTYRWPWAPPLNEARELRTWRDDQCRSMRGMSRCELVIGHACNHRATIGASGSSVWSDGAPETERETIVSTVSAGRKSRSARASRKRRT